MTDERDDSTTPGAGAVDEIDPAILLTERARQAALIRQKQHRDDKRDAITRKATELHHEAVEAFDEANPEMAAIGSRQVADQADAGGPRHRVTVYGQEQDLTGAQLSAQIEESEQALQDAATRERQLEEWARNLQTYADQLRAQPPAAAADPEEIKQKIAEAQAALLRGDDIESSELLAEAIAKATVQRPQVSAPRPMTREQGMSREEKIAVNTVFETRFGDLDDVAFNDAKALMLQRLNDPRNAHRAADELALEVGNLVRRVAQPSAEPRRTLKATIPYVQPPASMRAPPPAPTVDRSRANASYVEQLRQRSGSNSTINR